MAGLVALIIGRDETTKPISTTNTAPMNPEQIRMFRRHFLENEAKQKIQDRETVRLAQQRDKSLPPPKCLGAGIKKLLGVLKNLQETRPETTYIRTKSFCVYLRTNTRDGKENIDLTNIQVPKGLRGRGVFSAIEAALLEAGRGTLRVELVHNPALRRRFELLAKNPTSGWRKDPQTPKTFVKDCLQKPQA